MKRVVKSEQVAHLWAHQAQSDARNAGGNLSFSGPMLMSYRTPVAYIHKAKRGKVALLSNYNYSMTTAKQLNDAAHACRDVVPVFHVPFIAGPGIYGGCYSGSGKDWRVANRKYLTGLYTAEVARLTKSIRGPWGNAANWQGKVYDSLATYVRRVREYCEAFGLKMPELDLSGDAARIAAARSAIWDRHADREAIRRAREAAQREAWNEAYRKRREEEEKAEALEYPEKVAKWRAGELPYIPHRFSDAGERGALLRISADGANVETSQGADVPIADARRAVVFVASVRKRGEAWARNGERFQVGAFQLDRVSVEGNVNAGCHFIQWNEVAHLADLLRQDLQPATTVQP